jgi:peptide-methionine (S)-S-oxide reductase
MSLIGRSVGAGAVGVALTAVALGLTGGGSPAERPAPVAGGGRSRSTKAMSTTTGSSAARAGQTRLATFGGGCFWCVEAVYRELDGVLKVESGYSGGSTANPTYEQVCTGTTGHAEVIQVSYDPARVSYGDLLEVFFRTHDPTTLDRQGADQGTQYRSVVLNHDDEQRAIAEKTIRNLDAAKAFGSPIVTHVARFDRFYRAEEYHQDYFRRNPRQQYCVFVIQPKLDKFRKVFPGKLKKGND